MVHFVGSSHCWCIDHLIHCYGDVCGDLRYAQFWADSAIYLMLKL